MSLRLVTPASGTIVSLTEAKRQLRINHDDEDDHIISLIGAVNGWLDGENSWLGISVLEQIWELKGRAFGRGIIEIPRPPLVSVDGVFYTPDDGTEIELNEFREVDVGVPSGGGVLPAPNANWPDTNGDDGSVRIVFTAGYPSTPQPVRHAALLMVTHYYENRSEVLSDSNFETLPIGVRALLAPYRNWLR